jgi:integrase
MRRAELIDLAALDPTVVDLPDAGERLFRDIVVPGLALRLRASGARTWVRLSGTRPKRRTLGDASAIPIELARRMCTIPLAELVEGDAAGRNYPLSTSVAELVPHYLAAGEKGRWKASTVRNMRAVLGAHILPELGDNKVRDVTPEQVTRWHLGIAARTSSARMALSTLSGLMLYAEDHGLRLAGSNPCRGLRKKERGHRGRPLAAADIRRLWSALDRLHTSLPDVCDAIRLLLLTGARRSEILGLEWDHIAGGRAILADSKSGPRTIWLNGPARAILEARRSVQGGAFVFPNAPGSGPIKVIDREWKVIREKARLGDIRVHDLRHHFASVAVSNGIDLRIVGQLLGHHDLDSTLGYAHLARGSLVRSATRVSGLIDAALRSRPATRTESRNRPKRGTNQAGSALTPEVRHA